MMTTRPKEETDLTGTGSISARCLSPWLRFKALVEDGGTQRVESDPHLFFDLLSLRS
jgi:hypothetical protein